MSSLPIVGAGDHRYEVIHDWGELPDRFRYGNCHGVCIDSAGQIYIHHTVHATSESEDATTVFDADGKFVKSWGPDFKAGAHGLHLNVENGTEYLYLADHVRNIVVKTTLDGEQIYTRGYPIESEPYAAEPIKYRPTNVAVAPNGDLYIADGYGSNYVIQYDAAGGYIRTFGGAGVTEAESAEPGRLLCSHGIWCDTRAETPILLVADRKNRRIQRFSLEGEHLGFDYGVGLPCHFHERNGELVIPDLAARVTLLDSKNEVIVHLGEGHTDEADWRARREKSRDHFEPGKFVCPHGACFDTEGNIFVVEWVEIGRVTKLRKLD